MNYNSEYTGGTYIGGPIYMQSIHNAAYNYPLCINAGTGWIGYAGSCALSDIRAKQDIGQLDRVLDKIDVVKGVAFDWKDPERKQRDGRQIGLIAQDVEKAFPEATIRNRADKMLGLNYDSMVAVAIQCIRELKALFGELAAKVDALVAQVTGHDDAIKRLQAANDNDGRQIKALELENETLRKGLNDLRKAFEAFKAAPTADNDNLRTELKAANDNQAAALKARAYKAAHP